MNATGPVRASGRMQNSPVASRPGDHQRHARRPVGEPAEDRLADESGGGPRRDDDAEERQVDALIGEVQRQDGQQRPEAEPHDELGEQQREDPAPAVEPGVQAVRGGERAHRPSVPGGGSRVADPRRRPVAAPTIKPCWPSRPSLLAIGLVLGLLVLLPARRLQLGGVPEPLDRAVRRLVVGARVLPGGPAGDGPVPAPDRADRVPRAVRGRLGAGLARDRSEPPPAAAVATIHRVRR